MCGKKANPLQLEERLFLLPTLCLWPLNLTKICYFWGNGLPQQSDIRRWKRGSPEESDLVFTVPVGMLEKISVTFRLPVTLLDFHF
jgi:hypothetical protein